MSLKDIPPGQKTLMALKLEIPLRPLTAKRTRSMSMDDEEQLIDGHQQDKSNAKRHLRGWLSYAFARYVAGNGMLTETCTE